MNGRSVFSPLPNGTCTRFVLLVHSFASNTRRIQCISTGFLLLLFPGAALALHQMKMARFPIGCPSGKDSRIYKRQQINHRLLLMFPGAAQAIQGMKMARFPIGQAMIVVV
jgi:hypothetical protein